MSVELFSILLNKVKNTMGQNGTTAKCTLVCEKRQSRRCVENNSECSKSASDYSDHSDYNDYKFRRRNNCQDTTTTTTTTATPLSQNSTPLAKRPRTSMKSKMKHPTPSTSTILTSMSFPSNPSITSYPSCRSHPSNFLSLTSFIFISTFLILVHFTNPMNSMWVMGEEIETKGMERMGGRIGTKRTGDEVEMESKHGNGKQKTRTLQSESNEVEVWNEDENWEEEEDWSEWTDNEDGGDGGNSGGNAEGEGSGEGEDTINLWCGTSQLDALRNCGIGTVCPLGVCPGGLKCFMVSSRCANGSSSGGNGGDGGDGGSSGGGGSSSSSSNTSGGDGPSGSPGSSGSSNGGGSSTSASETESSIASTFYCGYDRRDANENCHKACPSGESWECFSEMTCFSFTDCGGADGGDGDAGGAGEAGGAGGVDNVDNVAASEGSGEGASDVIEEPGEEMEVEPAEEEEPVEEVDPLTTYYCGTTSTDANVNCHRPCPSGYSYECPSGMTCFGYTSCISAAPSKSPTMSPTEGPSVSLSPTGLPTGGPTNSPAAPAESESSTGSSSKFDIRNTYFCGTTRTDASLNCHSRCPSGTREECPEGMNCFGYTSCSVAKDEAGETGETGGGVGDENGESGNGEGAEDAESPGEWPNEGDEKALPGLCALNYQQLQQICTFSSSSASSSLVKRCSSSYPCEGVGQKCFENVDCEEMANGGTESNQDGDDNGENGESGSGNDGGDDGSIGVEMIPSPTPPTPPADPPAEATPAVSTPITPEVTLFCAATIQELEISCGTAQGCGSSPCPTGMFCFPFTCEVQAGATPQTPPTPPTPPTLPTPPTPPADSAQSSQSTTTTSSQPSLLCAASINELKASCGNAQDCSSSPCPGGTFCFPYTCESTGGASAPLSTPNPTPQPTPPPVQPTPSAEPPQQQLYCAKNIQELELACASAQECNSGPCPGGTFCFPFTCESKAQTPPPQQPDLQSTLCPPGYSGWHGRSGEQACKEYLLCADGVPAGPLYLCDEGLRFDQFRNACFDERKVNPGNCLGPALPPEPEMEEEVEVCPGSFTGWHARNECKEYYQCDNGPAPTGPIRTCGEGLKFDKVRAKCNDASVVNSYCYGPPLENIQVALCPQGYSGWHGRDNCKEYLQCNNGVAAGPINLCSPGFKFDKMINECNAEHLVNDQCYGPSQDNVQVSTLCPEGYNGWKSRLNCKEYYACENGAPGPIYTCPWGSSFDMVRAECIDENAVNESCYGPTVGHPEIDLCPDKFSGYHARRDCKEYYFCNNGEPDPIMTCGDGLRFDKVRLECYYENAVSKFCYGPALEQGGGQSQQTAGGGAKPNEQSPGGGTSNAFCMEGYTGWFTNSNCKEYVYCDNGFADGDVHYCDANLLFDRELELCTKDAVCNNNPPLDTSSSGGENVPSPTPGNAVPTSYDAWSNSASPSLPRNGTEIPPWLMNERVDLSGGHGAAPTSLFGSVCLFMLVVVDWRIQ